MAGTEICFPGRVFVCLLCGSALSFLSFFFFFFLFFLECILAAWARGVALILFFQALPLRTKLDGAFDLVGWALGARGWDGLGCNDGGRGTSIHTHAEFTSPS